MNWQDWSYFRPDLKRKAQWWKRFAAKFQACKKCEKRKASNLIFTETGPNGFCKSCSELILNDDPLSDDVGN